MEKGQRIGFISRDYKDFTFYTALLLNNLGKRILIADDSPEQDFSVMLYREDRTFGYMTYRNIDFCFDGVDMDKLPLQEYDYVLHYFGENGEGACRMNCEYVVWNTSMKKQEIAECMKGLLCLQKQNYLILRDLTGGGMDRRYLKQHYREAVLRLQKLYEIPLDYVDKDYQTEMDYNGVLQFRHLSKAYCDVLVDVVKQLTDFKRKEIERAFHFVKEGRIFDSRILE